MIYLPTNLDEPLDQGDVIGGCPIASVATFDPAADDSAVTKVTLQRIVVLTQTCDLAQQKTLYVNVAVAFDAQYLVDEKLIKPADIKGQLRSGRIWGLYFLPADADLGLPEMIVDFRRIHTIKLELLRTLCRAGKRLGRVRPLYREHLAKHFADTFSRIGLPRPYETL